MPSFLSKVFGRKKDEKSSPQSQGRVWDGSLLDGKFEAVSPTVSPSVTDFLDRANGKSNVKEKEREREREKEKERSFGLFRVKSAPSSPNIPHKKDDLPQLSLVLPVPKEDVQTRALGVVFEADPDAQILTDATIGNRRLNPLEALILVRTCSQAITTRGLETLGLMHPHWYSSSPDIQRKLISLFIHSLKSKPPITTLSPTSSSPTSVFESEVSYTRSPHDVAAVLRWGLRHLELPGNTFGKEESWYKAFAEAERNSEYPPKAYSEKLGPLVPASHLELLNATLELFSSLAAHAEKNSTSGSKLTRAFGLWLLSTQRSEENDDWPKFYARWERAGRILEHIFLARIRDEALGIRMPTRLLELVAQYPYSKGSAIENDVFLRPRLSTRQHGALFVRVESEFSSPSDKVKRHPLQFIKDAFNSETTSDKVDYVELWERIKKASTGESDTSSGGHPNLGHVFADETIRYLTLIPGDHPLKEAASPTFSVIEIPQYSPTFRRQTSLPAERSKPLNGTSNGHVKPATDPSPIPSSTTSPMDTDWAQFSAAGFSGLSPSTAPLASTLFGQDVEKTNPPSRRPSRRTRVSRSPSANTRRKSLDTPRTAVTETSRPEPEPPKLVSKSIPVSLVQLDEAFIEFWTDALLDPISSNWPSFVLCRLKSSVPDLKVGERTVEYLIIEHTFVSKPQPPAPAEVVNAPVTPSETLGASSPKSEKRFFGFFTSSGRGRLSPSVEKVSATTGKNRKKFSPQAKVTELGEVLKEEEETKPGTTVKLRIPSPKPRASADVTRKSMDVGRKSTDASKEAVKDSVKGVEEAKPIGGNANELVAVATDEAKESGLTTTDAALAPVGDLETAELAQSPAAESEEVEQAMQQPEPAVVPALAPAPEEPDQSSPAAVEEVAVAPQTAEAISDVPEPPNVPAPVEESPKVEPSIVPLSESHPPPVVEEAVLETFKEPVEQEEPLVAADPMIAPEQLSTPTVDATDAAPGEQLIAEAPVEEPLPEEPSLEEPVVEAPVEEPLPEEPGLGEPVVEASTIEEPAAGVPAVTEPVVVEDTAEEPVVKEAAADAAVIEGPSIEDLPVAPTAVEEERPLAEESPVEELATDTAPTLAIETVEPLAEDPPVEEPAADTTSTLAVETTEPPAEELGAEEPLIDQSTTLAEETLPVTAEEEIPAPKDQNPTIPVPIEGVPTIEADASATEESTEVEPSPAEIAIAEISAVPEPTIEDATGPVSEAPLVEAPSEPEEENDVEEPSHVEAPLDSDATEHVADSSTSLTPEIETTSVEPPVELAEPEPTSTPAETLVDEKSSAPITEQSEDPTTEPAESFDVISSTPRIEPLPVPVEDDTADEAVSQDPVPVVEAPPPAVDDAEHIATILVEDAVEEPTTATAEPVSIVQPPTNVTASGSTPGPRVALDIALAPANESEGEPALLVPETANGNGHHATIIEKDVADDESMPAATTPELLSTEAESTVLTEAPALDTENPDPEPNSSLDNPPETEDPSEGTPSNPPETASATARDD